MKENKLEIGDCVSFSKTGAFVRNNKLEKYGLEAEKKYRIAKLTYVDTDNVRISISVGNEVKAIDFVFTCPIANGNRNSLIYHKNNLYHEEMDI